MRNARLRLSCLVVGLLLSGCAGVSRVATMPLDAGVVAHYHASIEEVTHVVPEALDANGQREVERGRSDSLSIAVLGLRGANFMSWGEVSRTLVTTRSGGGSEVRVVTRPRYLLDMSESTSHSLRVIGEIDRLLGPGRVELVGGERVRAVGPGGASTGGTLVLGDGGGLTLGSGDSEAGQLPLDSLTRVEVLRGSYGNGRIGATVGVALGFVVFLVSADQCRSLDCSTSAAIWVPVIGAAVGALLGTAFRSEVWSRVGRW